MALSLENFTSKNEGLYVVHERAKQRSDKQQSHALWGRGQTHKEQVDFAGILQAYISQVNILVDFFGLAVAEIANRKNSRALIPQEMAKTVDKDDV